MFFASLAVAAMVGISSCSTEAVPDPVEGDSMVSLINKEMKEEAIIEEIIDDVLFDLEQYEFKKSESTCPVITIERPEDAKYPRVVTKDYGDGCIAENGVEKSGKVIITITGPWLEEGSQRLVEFENYTHRGTAVGGQKVITCKGLNEDGLYYHTIRGKVELTREDGKQITRELFKTRIMLAGFRDPEVPKEWLLDGHVNVTHSEKGDYVINIREPLHRIQGCRWAQSGVKVIRFNIEEEVNVEAEAGSEYTHKVVIDYSYVGEEGSACDSWVLRKVDDGEAVPVDLNK